MQINLEEKISYILIRQYLIGNAFKSNWHRPSKKCKVEKNCKKLINLTFIYCLQFAWLSAVFYWHFCEQLVVVLAYGVVLLGVDARLQQPTCTLHMIGTNVLSLSGKLLHKISQNQQICHIYCVFNLFHGLDQIFLFKLPHALVVIGLWNALAGHQALIIDRL